MRYLIAVLTTLFTILSFPNHTAIIYPFSHFSYASYQKFWAAQCKHGALKIWTDNSYGIRLNGERINLK